MSLAAAAASLVPGSTSISIFERNGPKSGFRPVDKPLFGANFAGAVDGRYRMRSARVYPIWSEVHVPLAATSATDPVSVVVKELDEGLKGDYGKLNEDLGRTSSLAIVKEGQLGKLGDIIYTLPFSGAETVSSLASWLTVWLFLVFSLKAARLNTYRFYQFFDALKQYNIYDEDMFLDAVEGMALIGDNGVFITHKDGCKECCKVKKVTPLWRVIKSLLALITGLKDKSTGTRVVLPVILVDPSLEGSDNGICSFFKWNAVSNVVNQEYWGFLQAMEVLFYGVHFQRCVSIGYAPCIRSPVLSWHVEKQRMWPWEDTEAKKHGIYKGCLTRDGTVSEWL
ncbi:5'-adenylylsulfate reductase 2, chloroplastic [Morella rubra]|uniref:5'-adenylylsulfate reductase 2, chloroplastic n=1 Tax=Morella rubra TaxID=262757 RepID=A0A6A1UNY9_9ROSI|nr:5'-adenylylsulfate reductase 2, chloroplastic [Morella rubra]